MATSALKKQLDDECPRGDETHLYARTLHRACQKLGSLKTLARQLKLSPRVVVRMLDGKASIPQAVFLAAVDILVGTPDRDLTGRN